MDETGNGKRDDPLPCPKMGPDPVLLTRKEVDALYEALGAVVEALNILEVPYVITGGTLLGAVRQHSLLFCDDDVDLAIIGEESLEKARNNLGRLLGGSYHYQIEPWEGGDRVRPVRMNTVFVDIFALRSYETKSQLIQVLERKTNGGKQTEAYVNGIVDAVHTAAGGSPSERNNLYPLWHFNTRKAVELWSKEVYRFYELFPLTTAYKFGPLTGISGPAMPVTLLKRAFGEDCFEVFYQSGTHTKGMSKIQSILNDGEEGRSDYPPLIFSGGAWESGKKQVLEDYQYLPMQPVQRAKRRPSLHNRDRLMKYLETQESFEKKLVRDWLSRNCK